MKRLSITVAAIIISFGASAFANGPMNDPAPTGGGTTMSPGREKWTRKRMGHLKRRRISTGHQLEIHTGMGDPFAGANNPYLTGDEAELRRRDAIRRQREIDAIELLALKKERGELSPAGQKKLNQLIRHVQNR